MDVARSLVRMVWKLRNVTQKVHFVIPMHVSFEKFNRTFKNCQTALIQELCAATGYRPELID